MKVDLLCSLFYFQTNGYKCKLRPLFGEVAERLNAAASKVVSRFIGTGVRIPPSPQMYYIYILKSINDRFHYIGHSEDIETRLKQHNAGKVRASKAHRPYTLIYSEEHQTKSEAQKREYYLKRGKGNIWLRTMLIEKGLW